MGFFDKIKSWYLSRNALPYWFILLADGLVLYLSGILAYWLFEGIRVTGHEFGPLMMTLTVFLLLSMVGERIFSIYSGIVRFSSFIDLARVTYANLLSAVLAVAATYLLRLVPGDLFLKLELRHVVAMYVIATLLMIAVRVVVKLLYDIMVSDKHAMRVLIYGVMQGGVGLAKNIRNQRPAKFVLKGFITHDPALGSSMLMGQRVYAINDDLERVIRDKSIEAVIVSPLRNEEFRKNQHFQDMLLGAGVKIYMTQSVHEVDIRDGEIKSDAFEGLHEVSVEDLLPRDEIKIDMGAVGALLTGRRVLITGSAGSIGGEMVRQVVAFKPAAMMLIDQAETPEHDIRLLMKNEHPDVEAATVVTSICKADRMEQIFKEFKPDYVFHAAAYKHVPMMEDNPAEAVQNNIYGTKVLADLSAKYGVKKFVMISTDKAVNPTNVMGCSKRICEIYCQSLNDKLWKETQATGRQTTQFITTRFGNVLGSNGSVIPLFREQIKRGGPVTVTDERIVRFFMLIPEACKLVLEAGTMGHGGEIFVFDMGEPVLIADLAKRMIKLSGARNVKIEYTGLREGEKLYEEVLDEKENTKPTFHDKIRIANVRVYDYESVSREIDELIEISHSYSDMDTVRKMKLIVPEYVSNNSVYEVLDKELEGKR